MTAIAAANVVAAANAVDAMRAKDRENLMATMRISYIEFQAEELESRFFAGKGWYGSGIDMETRRREHVYDVETPDDISEIISLCNLLDESLEPDYEYRP